MTFVTAIEEGGEEHGRGTDFVIMSNLKGLLFGAWTRKQVLRFAQDDNTVNGWTQLMDTIKGWTQSRSVTRKTAVRLRGLSDRRQRRCGHRF